MKEIKLLKHIGVPDENGIITTRNDIKYNYRNLINVIKETLIKNPDVYFSLYNNFPNPQNDPENIIGICRPNIIDYNIYLKCKLYDKFTDIANIIENEFSFGVIAISDINEFSRFANIVRVEAFQIVQTNYNNSDRIKIGW